MKSKTVANLPTLRDLLDAGAHFGHRKEWSTPASRKYTYVIRDGVCVINLEETQSKLADAIHKLQELSADGKMILLVGTKRQAREAVAEAGKKAGMPFVAQRWLGGTLTNFSVIRSNIQRLTELEQLLANEKELAKFTKRERKGISDEVKKLHETLDGIISMTRLPDMLLVVDPQEESTAVHEAQRLGIPVMAICDTDTDPDKIEFPIPANDDAPKAVSLIMSILSDAMSTGAGKAKTE